MSRSETGETDAGGGTEHVIPPHRPRVLREAYRRTRKDGATGVDEMTAKDYASKLDEHLASLLERFKSGTYWAPPVRRVHIPKGDGTTTRPIGIPTFEDKVLQRAVTMVMEAVYEQDFLDCSWGFRPGRSAHGALETLREGLRKMQGGWVLESLPPTGLLVAAIVMPRLGKVTSMRSRPERTLLTPSVIAPSSGDSSGSFNLVGVHQRGFRRRVPK